jgi:hypothetical protein
LSEDSSENAQIAHPTVLMKPDFQALFRSKLIKYTVKPEPIIQIPKLWKINRNSRKFQLEIIAVTGKNKNLQQASKQTFNCYCSFAQHRYS